MCHFRNVCTKIHFSFFCYFPAKIYTVPILMILKSTTWDKKRCMRSDSYLSSSMNWNTLGYTQNDSISPSNDSFSDPGVGGVWGQCQVGLIILIIFILTIIIFYTIIIIVIMITGSPHQSWCSAPVRPCFWFRQTRQLRDLSFWRITASHR